MDRRGFLTALLGGALTGAVVVESAQAQFFTPFEPPAPPEWEDRRDRWERRRRERWEREQRRRYYRRRRREYEDDDDD